MFIREEFIVTGKSLDGKWAISYSGGKTIYIPTNKLKISVDTEIINNVTFIKESNIKAWVASTQIKLYQQPDENTTSIKDLIIGTQVNVIGTDNNGTWLQIQVDGTTGYVKMNELSINEISPFDTRNEVVYVTASSLNFRSGPGRICEIIGQIPYRTAVTRLGLGSEWSMIEYNGTKGYVSNNYLSYTQPTVKVVEDTSSQTAQIPQNNQSGEIITTDDYNISISAKSQKKSYMGQWEVGGGQWYVTTPILYVKASYDYPAKNKDVKCYIKFQLSGRENWFQSTSHSWKLRQSGKQTYMKSGNWYYIDVQSPQLCINWTKPEWYYVADVYATIGQSGVFHIARVMLFTSDNKVVSVKNNVNGFNEDQKARAIPSKACKEEREKFKKLSGLNVTVSTYEE